MRIVNRPLAFVVAVAFLAGTVILVAEVIAAAMHDHSAIVHWQTTYAWAERTKWKAGVIRFWSVVLTAVGLLLLVLELKPARASRLPIASDSAATDAAITRRGLRDLASAAATTVDGIRGASTAVSAHRVSVHAVAAAKDQSTAQSLQEPVTDAVQTALDKLQMETARRVSVRVRTRTN